MPWISVSTAVCSHCHALLRSRSLSGEAIRHALGRMPKARPSLDKGLLEPDNTICERSIRARTLGRKSCLFLGSEDGGKPAAIACTRIETARKNGVNPEARLTWASRAYRRPQDHPHRRTRALQLDTEIGFKRCVAGRVPSAGRLPKSLPQKLTSIAQLWFCVATDASGRCRTVQRQRMFISTTERIYTEKGRPPGRARPIEKSRSCRVSVRHLLLLTDLRVHRCGQLLSGHI
jgi:hypothetical protein